MHTPSNEKPNFVGIILGVLMYAAALFVVNQPIPGPMISFAIACFVLPYTLTGYVADRVQHPVGSFLAGAVTYFGSAFVLMIPLAIVSGF